MTSTTVTTFSPTDPNRSVDSRAGWYWFAVIGLLFLAVHWSFINRMVHVATKMKAGKSLTQMLGHIIKEPWSPDWSHLMVVPLISAFFVFRNRHRLAELPRRIYPAGLVIFFLGLLGFAWGVYPVQNDMFQGLCMVGALFGMVLFLMGPARMRVLWFPIVYLLFFVKISDRIWNRIAEHLQDITAEAATIVLTVLSRVLDFDVSKHGNVIEIGFMDQGNYVDRPLTVAEACSGLRMLMAFVALGVAMAYLANRTWWQRLIMVLMAVPIAVAINVARVTVLGLLTMVNEEMVKGDFHIMIGMFMLIPAAGLFWLLGWVLDKLVIHDQTGGGPTAPPPAPDLPPASPDRARPPGHHFAAVLRGLAIGVGLTALVSLNYYLLFIVFQPQRNNLDLQTAIVLFAISLAMLLVSAMLTRRVLVFPIDRPGALSWLGRRTSTIALATVVGILLTAMGSLNAAIKYNNVVLNKEPLKLRMPLYRLPKHIGPWDVVQEADPLDPQILEVLGTTDYITWDYADKTLKSGTPGSRLRLHIAYYTGIVDTVAHVPERCLLAAGAKHSSTGSLTLKLEGSQYRSEGSGFLAPSLRQPLGVYIPSLDIPVTLFRYYLPGREAQTRTAVYFFVANGRFFDSPDKVRAQGMAPWDRYRYYCKVEMGLIGVNDRDEIARHVTRFLSQSMPEIMACLPDWRQVTEPPRPDALPQQTQ